MFSSEDASGQPTITVSFDKTEQTTFKETAEAKIETAYYETLEQAIQVAELMETAVIAMKTIPMPNLTTGSARY